MLYEADKHVISYELHRLCELLQAMADFTDLLFTVDSPFGKSYPEPDGYRYLGSGRYGSTSR